MAIRNHININSSVQILFESTTSKESHQRFYGLMSLTWPLQTGDFADFQDPKIPHSQKYSLPNQTNRQKEHQNPYKDVFQSIYQKEISTSIYVHVYIPKHEVHTSKSNRKPIDLSSSDFYISEFCICMYENCIRKCRSNKRIRIFVLLPLNSCCR